MSPYDGSGYVGVDRWLMRDDDPGRVGRGSCGPAVHCLDCTWRGKQADAMAHHRESRHHKIVLRDAPHWGPLLFACCSELATKE